MPKQAKYVLLFAVGMFALAIGLWWMSGRDGTSGLSTSLRWGQGELKASEQAYYANRVNAIISAWQEMAGQAGRSKAGEVEDSHFTCLAVDTAKKEIWIERDGRTLPEYGTDLPERMAWKLRHCGPHVNAELPAVSRFRIRGVYSRRLKPERIYLVGTSGNQEHWSCSFSSATSSSSLGTGPWRPPQVEWPSPSSPEGTGESYGSILVSQAEYEEAKRRFAADGDSVKQPFDWEPLQLKDNRATWARVEKRLYQEIDRQVMLEGFVLRTLEVECGPDVLAASAEVSAGRSGWLNAFRKGPSSVRVYLKVDYLGDDVWYAKSAPHPLYPVPRRLGLDLEFLVSATGQVPKESRDRLLEEGRARQQDAITPPSQWQVTLPSGVRVEFVGICENPSAGKDWWGPDGSPLGYVPYENYERYGPKRDDRKVYEIAWRIHLPRAGASGTRSSLEGCVGSYDRQLRDRYGNAILAGLNAAGYAFDASRKQTTLKLGVKLGDGDFEWASFRNISLVPGVDPGFEIVEGTDDTKE